MKRFHKLTAWLLTLAMLMTFIPGFTLTASAAEVASGTTGDVSWTLTDDGTLTFSGEGAMGNDQSWISHVGSITSIVIEDGITSIANYAFYECSSLKSVTLPASLTKIGNYAFTDCSNLESVTIPASVSTIGNAVFYGCSSLATVNYLGTSEPSIGNYVFIGCSLTHVTVSEAYTGSTFGGMPVVKSGSSTPTTYTVTVDASIANGTVEADVSEAEEGDTVTLTITPDEGYALKTLTVGGEDVTENVADNAYKFEMSAAEVVVTATFAEVYSVTRSVYAGYTITRTADTILPIKYGDSYAFTVEITNGYVKTAEFAVKAGNKEDAAEDLTALTPDENGVYTITNITSDIKISVVGVSPYKPDSIDDFKADGNAPLKLVCEEDDTHSITAPYFDSAYITVGDINATTRLCEVTFNVAKYMEDKLPGHRASGYIPDNITMWLKWDVDASKWEYTTTREHTITCAPETYAVSVNTPSNGTVIADKTTAAENDTVTLTVTPATGYEHESLTVDGTDVTAQVTNGTYTFTMPKGDVTVSATFKVSAFSANISAIDSASGNALAGASMQILNEEGSVEEEWVSTEEAHTVTGLVTGEEYTLRATVAPDGYTIASDTSFTIDESGNVSSTGTVSAEGALLVEFARTKVQISAVDAADGEAIAGAYMQIINSTGNVVDEWVSTTATHHTVEGLKIGEEYTLRVTVAPEGYTIPTDTTFVIKEKGNITTTGNLTEDGIILSVFDLTVVKISAVDFSSIGNPLAGATMQILDARGNLVEEWVSVADTESTEDVDESVHTVIGLKTGVEYTLRATVAPDGYAIPTDITFAIQADGTLDTGGIVTEDGVLWIQFAENPKYTITYVLDGGTINGEYVTSYAFGDSVGLPQSVTREGYRFAGWYDAAEGGTGPIMGFGRPETGDKTFYARWTPKTYTVTWWNEDYSVLEKDENVPYGTMPSYDSAVPTKTENAQYTYTFTGWTPEVSVVTGNATYMATYNETAKTYRINYLNLEDGTINGEYATSYTFGEGVSLPQNVTREGYTFDGWYDAAEGGTGPLMAFGRDKSGDLTVYAHWTPKTYTVTFVDADGKTIGEPQTVAHGKAATAPEAPAKTGHTFSGWDQAFDNVTSDLTVQAQYRINQYTITFDTDGGTAVASITQDYGTAVTAPADPTKSGYTFAGWNKDIPTIIPAENVTITAQWTLGIPVVSNVSGYSGEYDGVSHEISVIVDVVPDIDYSYQWYKDGKEEGNKINGATSAEYTVKDVADSGTYYCKVTASDGIQAQTVWSDNVDVTIAKKSIEAAIVALDGSLTYTGAEQIQNVTVTLDGFTITFDVTDNKATNVKADGNYTLKVTANGNFIGEKTLEWNIAKADHIIEGENIPTASRIRRGNKLSDSTITPAELKDADENVLGTFTWVTPDDEMTETGDFVKQVKFTPTDTNNYNEKTFDVTVNVYRPSSGGGGSSNTSTTTTKNEDGSTTKVTENKATGTKTEVTTNTDGSTTTVETKKDGTKVTTETNADGETTAEVVAKGETEVVIPVPVAEEVTKVVVTDKDGSVTEVEFEVKDGGIAISVSGNSTVSVQTGHTCYAKDFTDVDLDAWYHLNVDYVLENGLFKGTTKTTFAPNANLTRAMLVTVLYRAEGEPATNRSIPFADVDMGMYYANAVIWAKQNGIVNGVSENEFAPNDNITREQIAAIMHRYAQYKGYDVSVGENTNILSYDDFNSISEYAIASMQWAVGSGLIKGKSESTLNPLDNATRAEVAAILNRFIEAN